MLRYPRIVDRVAVLILGLFVLAGLLWIGAYKIKEAKTLTANPITAYCSLVKSRSDGETDVRIRLETGKNALRLVYLNVGSDPMYQATRFSYVRLRSESTVLRKETIHYPRAVDGVSCWVALVVYEDGREWRAPSRGPSIP